VSDNDLVLEVRRLRELVEQHAEEIARLRTEARQVRVDTGHAANARLTPEEFAFAREMAMSGKGIDVKATRGRLRA
jgi:hypothetical protein